MTTKIPLPYSHPDIQSWNDKTDKKSEGFKCHHWKRRKKEQKRP